MKKGLASPRGGNQTYDFGPRHPAVFPFREGLGTAPDIDVGAYSSLSKRALILDSLGAPTCLLTSLPSLKKRSVGMLRTAYSMVMSSFCSTSHLPTTNLPSYSSASFDTSGEIALQGPHQVAHRSTTNGRSPFLRVSKLSFVISTSIVFFV